MRQEGSASVDHYTNELEQFIYQVCYQRLWEAVNNYVAQHPTSLDLSYCRVKYPDIAYVEDMVLEFSKNICIEDDTLSFDAVVSCTVYVEEDGYKSAELSQWLLLSCDAVIEDKLKSFTAKKVSNYRPGQSRQVNGAAATSNIVPILYKKDLEAEAEDFLEKYYPAALQEPTPVPIEEIAVTMGLDVVQGYRITNDFSVFGEICFSAGQVETYDLFECTSSTLDVKRGTILIDAYTYWERNIGCVNNTIAHEVYHWYKHRLYAAVKQILRKEKLIACRCPSDMVYPSKSEEWTDEQRMEWQANNMAPRILMPQKTFRMKVDELYAQYNYSDSPIKPVVLTCIADKLAKFYGVSRQSALIRMIETGYKEAASVYQYDNKSGYHSYINAADAFYVYSNYPEFRQLIDSGLFRYVDGYYVINDEKYVERLDDGRYSLTDNAWANLSECTLKFTWQTVRQGETHRHLPVEIFHRANEDQKTSKCDIKDNAPVIQMSEELQKKRAEFERQKAVRQITSPNITCWQMMYQIIESRGLSKPHFCRITGLGEEVYRKAEKNVNTKPSIRTIVAFAHGLDLDLANTEKMMQLAGHAFDESDEHQALKFCITGYAGHPIEECNDFLKSYGYEPLGTQQRL